MTFLLNPYIHGAGAGALTALASADFVNGDYEVAGSSVAASDVVDTPGAIGANGLQVTASSATIELIGTFLTTILTGNWTIIIEYEEQTSTGDNYVFACRDADSSYESIFALRRSNFGGLGMIAEETGSASRNANDSASNTNTGIHKIAVTRTDAKLVLSIDGRAIKSSATALTEVWSRAGFGNYPGDSAAKNTRIRTFGVYDPQDDADLPGLSSL